MPKSPAKRTLTAGWPNSPSSKPASLALSLTRAKLAYKAGRLTADHLERVGLVWDRGQDKFSFKPSRVVVRTEANFAEVG